MESKKRYAIYPPSIVSGMGIFAKLKGVFGSRLSRASSQVAGKRNTFTEQFEYPELPVPVAERFRGFHRYDLTTCIACGRCAPRRAAIVDRDLVSVPLQCHSAERADHPGSRAEGIAKAG